MRASHTAEEGAPETTNPGAHKIVELLEGNTAISVGPPGNYYLNTTARYAELRYLFWWEGAVAGRV